MSHFEATSTPRCFIRTIKALRASERQGAIQIIIIVTIAIIFVVVIIIFFLLLLLLFGTPVVTFDGVMCTRPAMELIKLPLKDLTEKSV